MSARQEREERRLRIECDRWTCCHRSSAPSSHASTPPTQRTARDLGLGTTVRNYTSKQRSRAKHREPNKALHVWSPRLWAPGQCALLATFGKVRLTRPPLFSTTGGYSPQGCTGRPSAEPPNAPFGAVRGSACGAGVGQQGKRELNWRRRLRGKRSPECAAARRRGAGPACRFARPTLA